MADEFLLGVNYWPARKFVRMWSHFDAGEVARDFSLIRGLGLRLVRIFLFWPDFQPQPDAIDREQLDKLAVVFDLATRRGLLLMPTLLVGHMSGPDWMPAWAMSDQPNNRPAVYAVDGAVVSNKPRDLFGGDQEMLAAQRLLVRAVVERFRAHSALWGWDVCNEIDLVQAPVTAAGEHWLRTIVDDIHMLDGGHPVTAGFVGWPDAVPRGFHRESHRLVDVASVHAYPLYDASSAGWGDTAYVRRTIEETRERAGVPVMLAEFGLPVNPEPGTHSVTMTWAGHDRTVALVDEGEAGRYVHDVLPAARDAGATGALIWCFSDYAPEMYGEMPFDTLVHERYFGIYAADGRLKATGEAMRDFARSLRPGDRRSATFT
jgi:beta-galactosidase